MQLIFLEKHASLEAPYEVRSEINRIFTVAIKTFIAYVVLMLAHI